MRLTSENINQRVVSAKYAVRGELAVKSEEYRAKIAKGDTGDLPFKEVISANIGNPQQLDQKPITFFRQVASLLENPLLLQNEEALTKHFGYQTDVIERAKFLLSKIGSVGAYSASTGVPAIRDSIAKFIERGFCRRFCFCCVANLSQVAMASLQIPITFTCPPVPPLVSTPFSTSSAPPLRPASSFQFLSTLSTLLLSPCWTPQLFLTSWMSIRTGGTDVDTIRASYEKAKADGIDVRCIVIINPGNPTGASLPEEDIRAVLEFANKENLVVMADEVYQTNVFVGKFHSFKAVLRTLEKENPGKFDGLELASLHSVSKGMVGECGHRGGYFELVNFDAEVEANIYKFISIMLCAPVIGQCIVELMVNPPKPGEPSHELYKKEYDGIFTGLQERATALHKAFSQMEGVECAEPQGSMYLFPTINLPEKAAEAAKAEGRSPDEFYCMRLLEATGICVVPGSGFGQKEGTLHFRTTFLAPGTEWVGSIVKFHKEFLEKYR
ncbi:hypothetical protein Lal_00012342 [Lupinus albus]|nr:hypothetical protein Lal_00012342 [Lupinus albus]